MVKLTSISVFTLVLSLFAVNHVSGQEATPTATLTPTTTTTVTPTETPTPTPTGAVQGTTTVPEGAPATGFGGSK